MAKRCKNKIVVQWEPSPDSFELGVNTYALRCQLNRSHGGDCVSTVPLGKTCGIVVSWCSLGRLRICDYVVTNE